VEEEKNDMETRLAKMTRDQRLQYMQELLEPIQQHLLAAPKTTTDIVTAAEVNSLKTGANLGGSPRQRVFRAGSPGFRVNSDPGDPGNRRGRRVF
jgi:hypothetical protein